MATPGPPPPGEGGEVEDSQLVFMSHAPGVSLPPRVNVDESLAGKVLGRFAKSLDRGKDPGQSSAGVGALERALKANQRAKRRKVDVNETLDGASKHVGGEPTEGIVVGQTAPEEDPSLMGLLPGALLVPARGPLVTILHVLLVALVLFLLEVSPPLGIAGALLAAVELFGLRTRLVMDSCAGRDMVRWPEASEIGVSILIAIAAGAWCLAPGVGLGLAAWGGPSLRGDASVVARAKRIGNPAVLDTGAEAAKTRGFGHRTLLQLEALTTSRLGAPERSSAQVVEDLRAGNRAALTALVRVDQASPLGIAARLALLLGLAIYPMTILSAIRLRSVYAAIYPPIALRAAFTIPGAYLLFLLGAAVYLAGAGAGALLGLPALRELLGATPGHLAWLGGLSLYLVLGHMMLASLLGRVYRSRRLALGWD